MYNCDSMSTQYRGRTWAPRWVWAAAMNFVWNDRHTAARSRYGFIPGNGDGTATPPGQAGGAGTNCAAHAASSGASRGSGGWA